MKSRMRWRMICSMKSRMRGRKRDAMRGELSDGYNER